MSNDQPMRGAGVCLRDDTVGAGLESVQRGAADRGAAGGLQGGDLPCVPGCEQAEGEAVCGVEPAEALGTSQPLPGRPPGISPGRGSCLSRYSGPLLQQRVPISVTTGLGGPSTQLAAPTLASRSTRCKMIDSIYKLFMWWILLLVILGKGLLWGPKTHGEMFALGAKTHQTPLVNVYFGGQAHLKTHW